MDLFEDLKIEELDFEYESYQEGSQIFADIDANLTSVEGLENKELEEKPTINSKVESRFDEELNTDFIKSKKFLKIEKKSKPCTQYLTGFTTLRNVSSILKKINDKYLEAKLESDEEKFFAQLVRSKYPLILLNKFSHSELKKSSNSKNENFLLENIKKEPEEEHEQIQHESNQEKFSSCFKSSNFKTENIKEEAVEEHEQIQHESNEEKFSSCLKSSNSKNEIFLLENIKKEPEEEQEQIQHESNEEKFSSCLKSSNFKTENIKEEAVEEHEQIQHESNEEKFSSCFKSSNFKTENIKEEAVEEHVQIQHESNEEKFSSCLKSSNSKNEIFLLENIKKEPEEEHEQIQHESNEEKFSSCLKSSNSKNEIFLLENIKEEESEKEDEQNSLTGLNIERMDNRTKKLLIRERIIALYESGKTKTEIARNFGIHVSTVRRWIVRHEKEGNLCDRPKPGGPRRTTLNEDEQILQEIIENPFADSRAIKRALKLKVSDRTIRRRLRAPYSDREARKTNRSTQT